MSERKNIIKRVAVYFIAFTLVIGTALGAGLWLLNVEVPIRYDEPYRIYMSNEEIHETWNLLPFKDTIVTETADFSYSGYEFEYHSYVRIENPEDTSNVRIMVNIEEPEDFDNNMGFTVLDGIVEPPYTDVAGDDWGNITFGVPVEAGETVEFTVIYTLSDAPPSNDHIVTWEFLEEDHYYTDSFRVNPEPEIGDFNTINEAIAAAEDDMAIYVDPGTYEEPQLNMKPGMSLIGAGMDDVIINRDDSGYGIHGNRDDVTLTGFTLNNTASETHGWGLKLSGSDNIHVEDVRVQNSNRTGIDFNGVTNSVLKNVISMDNGGAGVSLTESSGITIDGVEITNNDWAAMAFYEDVHDVHIINCYIHNDLAGIWFTDGGYSNIVIQGNTFEDLEEHEDIEYPPDSGEYYSGTVYLIEPGFDVDFEFALANNDFDKDVFILGEEGVDDGQAIVNLTDEPEP